MKTSNSESIVLDNRMGAPLFPCYLINKQINMEGGQSGTYLRLTRASSGPQVSVAMTHRDETKYSYFRFISSLYVLATLTPGPDDALVLGK